jgi:hypothetical protein
MIGMYEKNGKLIRFQMENDTAVWAVEAMLEYAKFEDEQKFREFALSLANCIIKLCPVRKWLIW